MAESMSKIRHRWITPFVMAMAIFFCFAQLWADQAGAQVLALEIKPVSETPPIIEVLNDGKGYTRMAADSIDFPVNISASCANRFQIGKYYLITNSSETDFVNKQVGGTVGIGELGYMLFFRPKGANSALAATKLSFKVPLNELYSGDDPVPVQICNKLLERKIESGTAKSAVLAKDWKVIQPLAISFMPSCTRANTTFWSKASTTQLINYVCKASKIAMAEDEKRVANEKKTKSQAKSAAIEADKKKAALEAEKQAAAKLEKERNQRAAAKKAERVKIVKTIAVASSKPPAPEVKPEPKVEVEAAPKPVATLSITAEPQEYNGDCPALIAFKGKITAMQKGQIKFHFQDGDQAEATRAVMFNKKDHTRNFQTQALFEKSKKGSMKLIMETPQVAQVETKYAVVCKN